jgi:hypothetical protein
LSRGLCGRGSVAGRRVFRLHSRGGSSPLAAQFDNALLFNSGLVRKFKRRGRIYGRTLGLPVRTSVVHGCGREHWRPILTICCLISIFESRNKLEHRAQPVGGKAGGGRLQRARGPIVGENVTAQEEYKSAARCACYQWLCPQRAGGCCGGLQHIYAFRFNTFEKRVRAVSSPCGLCSSFGALFFRTLQKTKSNSVDIGLCRGACRRLHHASLPLTETGKHWI